MVNICLTSNPWEIFHGGNVWVSRDVWGFVWREGGGNLPGSKFGGTSGEKML